MPDPSEGDWKDAARRERDEAAERIESAGAGGAAKGTGPGGGPGAGDAAGGGATAGGAAGGADGAGGEDVPPANLAMLVMRLAAEARYHLHLVPEEAGVEVPDGPPDLKLARFVIDLVGMLETKTAGNRDEQEDALLRAVIDDLRLAYVEVSKKAASP